MSSREKISKSHLSGVVTLIFIVLFIQGVLFLFRSEDRSREDFVTESQKTTRDSIVKKQTAVFKERKEENPNEKELGKFDPNSIDKNGLVKLGLSAKQAQVVINYRNKGGKFKKREDFSKIYVISPKTYERVKNLIDINDEDIDQDIDQDIDEDINNDNDKDQKSVTGNINGDKPIIRSIINEHKTILSLNKADSADLISLPGIGPYYARKIIQYRERLGGFATKEQLLEIYGIDINRLDLFAHRIDVDTNDISKKDIMEASLEELSSNPYIGGYMARSIIRYRDKNGNVVINLANLVMNNIIKKELYKILKYYFK